MPQDNPPLGSANGISRPLASGLAVAAGLLRLVPHPLNLTPIGALGIFAGARLRSWHAFALPLFVLAVTDVVVWLLQGRQFPLFYAALPFVYGSFLINVLIGRLLARTESPVRIGAASLLASVQFFVVTNFGTWLTSALVPGALPSYPPTPSGLLTCYAAGVPFFGSTLSGDLLYCGVLFGLYAVLVRTVFPAERLPLATPAR
jgi:hypothetical protein